MKARELSLRKLFYFLSRLCVYVFAWIGIGGGMKILDFDFHATINSNVYGKYIDNKIKCNHCSMCQRYNV